MGKAPMNIFVSVFDEYIKATAQSWKDMSNAMYLYSLSLEDKQLWMYLELYHNYKPITMLNMQNFREALSI
jgi:hypothetical protein